MSMGRDLGLLLPQIALLLTAVLALVAGMLRHDRWALPITLLGSAVCVGLAVPLVDARTTVFAGTYRIDALSVWATLILVPATALVAVLARPEVRGSDREATVLSLLSFTTLGALVLAGSGDVIFLVLGLLLSGLGSFALVASPRSDHATEAGMKYFIFGAVSGGVMTYGLTFWFGATGSTLLRDGALLSQARPAGVAALLAVLIGLGYKAGVAPFHFWAPDAYEGAPLAVAAYLSVVSKIGAIFALAQFAQGLSGSGIDWRLAVATLAALSMTLGNLAALRQTNVVRLLAYSSIAQSGYFLVGLVGLGVSPLALRSLVVFAAAYAAMNVGIFAVVAQVGRELEYFTGLGRVRPWLSAAAVVFLLSLVGVPPLGGFIGKLLLFGAALDAGYGWLAVIAILNSVLSLAVYLRLIVPMYQPQPRPSPASRPTTIIWGTAFVLTLAIGLGAELFLGLLAGS